MSKRAISTVLTTIILLTSSLILAVGVSIFGVRLFQQSSLTEAISVYSIKLWVHDTTDGLAWGAVTIRNTGDTELSVNSIVVRGTDIPYSNWYADTTISQDLLQKPLNHTGWSGINGMIQNYDPDGLCNLTLKIDLDGVGGEDPICADVSGSPVSLQPSNSAIIYFQLINGTIDRLDAGSTTGVIVSAGKPSFISSVIVEEKS